jgi:hypothetical protein
MNYPNKPLNAVKLMSNLCVLACTNIPIDSHTLSKSSIRNFKSKSPIQILMFDLSNAFKNNELLQ